MRVRVVAHAPTRGMRDLLFGDTSRVERPDLVEPWSVRVDHWVCGPEPACVETARLLGGEPLVVEDLAAPRAGDWSGISLHQVEVSDPVGLQAWLTDPYAAPPGGERWIDAISRVGTALDALADRRSRGMVLTGPAARAVVAYALAGGPSVVFRCDAVPLSPFTLSGGPGTWRLRLGSEP
jgi:broad specificity phosphatase PhoE